MSQRSYLKGKLYGLDLFSGIGGITKALEEWVEPIAYCERDRYARGVLLSRMSEGGLPVAPIWDDVTTLTGTDLPHIDIIYGGFPCQDISIAGNCWVQKGLEGKRSRLFFEVMRLADEIQPSFIFLENVPAIRLRGGITVGKELARRGYDCRWITLQADAVGAPHKRKRWFLLAYANSTRFSRLQPETRAKKSRDDNEKRHAKSSCSADIQIPEAVLAATIRMDDGIPFQVDRIKSLGNAVVPEQAKKAFKILIGLNKL